MNEEILSVISGAGCYYLATIRDGAPELRPFGELFPFDGGLCFNTGKGKAVYHQLKADGRICLCAFYRGTWVRIRAHAEEDEREAARLAALEASPGLKKMYSADAGVFTVFRLQYAEAEIHRGNACETIKL